MKKKIILIGLLFLLSGCDVQYNLEYKNDIFKENVFINGNENDNTNDIQFTNLLSIYNQSGLYVDYENNDAGDVEIVGDKYNTFLFNDSYGINFSYDFKTKNSYSNSSFINTLYKNFVINDSGIYMNSTYDIYGQYFTLNIITISFKTDKKVIEHNADKIENNIYYWYINKDNYEEKKIVIKFNNFESEKNKEYVKNGYLTNNFMNYIIIILVFILLLLFIVIYNNIKKLNKK